MMEEKNAKAGTVETNVSTDTQVKTMKKYTWIKVVSSVIIALLIVWLTYGYFSMVKPDAEGEAIGIVIYIVICLFEFGGIASLVSIAFSVSGLVLTLVKCPKAERKGQVIFFSALIAAPVIIEAVFYLLCIIVA